MIIHRNLKFDEYTLTQCKNLEGKLKALAGVCTYLSLESKRALMRAFIKLQFVCCLLISIFCQRSSNTRVNHLNEKALRIA